MKRTPLYEEHLLNEAKLVPYGGFLMPLQYTSILQEHAAVRESAGLFDVSHMGEIEITGPGAAAFLDRLLTNDMLSLKPLRARYSPMCAQDGGVVDDVLVYCFSEQRYMMVVNAANIDTDFEHIQSACQGDKTVEIKNISDATAMIALQGPRSQGILARIAEHKALPERPYTFLPGQDVADIRCIVSRTGYTGEDGLELYVAPEQAQKLWRAVMEAGAPEGILPCGLGARDTLRFEACMPLYGHELTRTITPLMAGLNRFVKLEKQGDFIGKQALMASGAPGKCLIGLMMTDRGIARENSPVFDEQGERVGYITSGMRAPTLKKNLAMALIDAGSARQSAFLVEVRDRKLRAQRVDIPFYKRKK